MSKKILFFVLLVAFLLSLLGIFYAHRQEKNEETAFLKDVQELINQKKYEEAIEKLVLQKALFSEKPGKDEALNLMIQTMAKEGMLGALLDLWQQFPKAFVKKQNEEAALLVAESLIANLQFDQFIDLQKAWTHETENPEHWLVLESDLQMKKFGAAKALEVLQSKRFVGAQDGVRLARLFLLLPPEKVIPLVDQAIQEAPNSFQLILLRGKMKEREGRLFDALLDFQTALQSAPKEPSVYEEMGDYYLRNGQKFLAFESWKGGLNFPNAENLWIKFLFWTKVLGPDFKSIVEKKDPPKGTFRSFIAYLMNLSPEEFWNEESFKNVIFRTKILTHVQESHWLRLLEALRIGAKREVEEQIVFNPFRNESYRPELELACLLVLRWQKTGSLVLPEPLSSEMMLSKKSPSISPFFTQVFDLARSGKIPDSSMKIVLESPEIFSLIFSEATWSRAAVVLNREKVIPADLPPFVAASLTQSYRLSEGPIAALQFALAQKPSYDLLLVTGEIFVALGKVEEAKRALEPIIKDSHPLKSWATLLLVTLEVQQKNVKGAKKILAEDPGLTNSDAGLDLLGKIAIMEGQKEDAKEFIEKQKAPSLESLEFLFNYYQEKGNSSKAEEVIKKIKERKKTISIRLD